MTFDERVTAVAPLGLPPRQTAFLVTVALHGGYCLRRQFDTFVGGAHGQVGRNLFDTLVNRHLATRLQYQPNRGHMYHVHAKPLYRAIGQDDNRNRRVVSPTHIARKLMVLDYVLTTPPAEWVATEQDKVALFTTRFGMALGDLPQRRYESHAALRPDTIRYFVHKLPIRVAPDGVVHFVHLVEDETGQHFEQYLADHVRLLSRVPAWTIVLVCPSHLKTGTQVCERVFATTFTTARPAMGAPDREDLRWFFRARQAVDRGDLRNLSVADLDRFRELRRRLTTAPVERVYAEWQRVGEAALVDVPQIADALPALMRVMAHALPWRYQQFGKLPGAA